MIQNKKRIISLILMLTLLVSALVVGAVTASAADGVTASVVVGEYAKANEWANGEAYKTITVDGNITVTASGGGNTAKYYTSGEDWRMYQTDSSTFTVTAGDGYVITSVKITYTNSNSGVLTYNGEKKASGEAIPVNATSATFGVGNTGTGTKGQVRVTAIEVVYETSSTEPDAPACEHTNTEPLGEEKAATCTEAGITAGEKCSACGETITVQEEIPALGHNYVNGTCSACGAVKPETPSEATISFADTTHRVSQDAQSQVWANSGLTLTNNKASSTSSIIDSSNPVRLYKNSTITIEFSGMTKIEFVCSSESYATALANSIAEGVKCVQDGTSVTLTFSKAMDEYTITLSGGQVRLYTITASAVKITCKHNNVTITTVDATCTEDGSITETCKDCGETVSTKVIEKRGHSYNDGEITTEPTCTEQGKKTYTCSVCNNKKTEAVVANGHKYVDGVCSACGEKEINYSGRFFIAAIRTTGNYFYMTSDLGEVDTKRYQVVDSGLKELTEAVCPKDGFIFVLVKNGDGTYKIYAEGVEGDNYLGWTSGNSGTLVAEADAICFTVDLLESGLYNIHFAESEAERYLALNGTSGNDYFAFYKSGQKQDLSLVPVSDGHIYVSGKCACGETATLTEAVAENNATIILGEGETLKDKLVITGSNVTIDLNGHTITASGLVTFGNGTKIIDSGTTKGLIKVAKRGNIVFAPEGSSAVNEGAITVWNGEGYVVADVTDRYVQPEVEGKADNSFIIDFKPKFDGVAHSQIAEGNDATGLIFRVKVTGTDGFDRTYTVSDSFIGQAYAGKSVRLNLINAKEGVTYTVQLIIESECRLHYVGELGQYKYTVPTDAE